MCAPAANERSHPPHPPHQPALAQYYCALWSYLPLLPLA